MFESVLTFDRLTHKSAQLLGRQMPPLVIGAPQKS